ncbi:MAG: hypothetical protein JOZ62_21670, partial [Acidobacteriaceae bacterium]|nr:hypothetical protein [Acidobacteriaceae bacterium]
MYLPFTRSTIYGRNRLLELICEQAFDAVCAKFLQGAIVVKFQRVYSAPGHPYAGVTFEPRDSRIVNPDGSVIFEAAGIMVPSGWSQVAVDVLAQKYCRKAGVPKNRVRIAEDGIPEWLQRSEPAGDATFDAER